MEREFVPVFVKKDKKDVVWYLDVSRLGIEELLMLKKELSGTKDEGVRLIDKIIYSKFNINRNLYDTYDSRYRKEKKKNNKELKKRKKFGGKKKW